MKRKTALQGDSSTKLISNYILPENGNKVKKVMDDGTNLTYKQIIKGIIWATSWVSLTGLFCYFVLGKSLENPVILGEILIFCILVNRRK